MHTPQIVILEARNQPRIADILHNAAEELLHSKGATCARVTVPTPQELPLALRLVIEATRNSGTHAQNGWHRPDGYITFGQMVASDSPLAEINYGEVLRSLNDLSCYYTIPLSLGLTLISHEHDQRYDFAEFGRYAALRCLSLIDLKNHLGLPPGSVFTP